MTAGGFFVRVLGGMAAGIAAVAAVLVLGTTHAQRASAAGGVLAAGQAHGAWANRSEFAWLHRIGPWEAGLVGTLSQAAAARTDRAALRALAPISSCASTLRSQVGAPPSARLTRAYRTFQQACAHLVNGVHASDSRTATTEARAGGALLLQADRLLPPGENRSLPVIAGAAATSRIDPRYGAIASRLAGKPVEVRCWSEGDWGRLMREESAYTVNHIDGNAIGFAGIYGGRANLSPTVCSSLDSFVYGGVFPTSAEDRLLLATAIVTLTHEPQHSKGIAVEAKAECYAIQLMRGTAVQLGATRAQAASLQALYWSRYARELPAYRSSECRNGGAYDLDRQSAIFP